MKKLFIFLFMSMSMSLYAIDSWADINAEIRLNERKLSEENETILSTRVRDKRGLKRRDSDADKMSGDHGRGRLIRF